MRSEGAVKKGGVELVSSSASLMQGLPAGSGTSRGETVLTGKPSDTKSWRESKNPAPNRFRAMDLYKFPAPAGRLLQEYFNLTPAEARLARFIARGEPLELAARTLGVKLPTVRSQLAAVFAKTNTCRQAQLVALLSRLAHLNPPPQVALRGRSDRAS
jgi:DNA-binding CsgD family transcriptional regulator